MYEIIASRSFQMFGLPVIFLLISVMLKALTRITRIRDNLSDILQVGIELCMINLSIHFAVIFLTVQRLLDPSLKPESSVMLLESLPIVAVAMLVFFGLTLACALLKGFLFWFSRPWEVVLGDMGGFLILAYGLKNLAVVIEKHGLMKLTQ